MMPVAHWRKLKYPGLAESVVDQRSSRQCLEGSIYLGSPPKRSRFNNVRVSLVRF